ncbi:MAG TPA: UbiA family prenyltransferase, partial [Nitrospiria bacterium]|nr:UbiA family prenyltransferase [Nitrospiria bacterium]
AVFYPFTKRFISLPQFVLGISFGWGAIMAWAAVRNRIELPAILIFSANIFWSMAYDTIYALMDRDDDLKAGVKSSAILLGKSVWLGVAFFLSMVIILLAATGWVAQIHPAYYWILAMTGIAFFLQVFQLKKNDSPEVAFRLFKKHGLLGFLILSGIVSAYLL